LATGTAIGDWVLSPAFRLVAFDGQCVAGPLDDARLLIIASRRGQHQLVALRDRLHPAASAGNAGGQPEVIEGGDPALAVAASVRHGQRQREAAHAPDHLLAAARYRRLDHVGVWQLGTPGTPLAEAA